MSRNTNMANDNLLSASNPMEQTNNNSIAGNSKGNMVKVFQLAYAAFFYFTNVLSLFLLYTHYGPLTPNGNRYYHEYDITSMDWVMVTFCSVASLLLLLPYLLCFRSNATSVFDLFPSVSDGNHILSKLLGILNLASGSIFTISLFLITLIYISSSRIMADDLETAMLIAAYVLCSLFWGLVDLIYIIYMVYSKRKR